MATYSPQSLGINANTTGGTFKQGAFYNGRQYWDGTLGEVGALHEKSNQVGAGQRISNDVIAQTNPANVSYIDSSIKASQLQPSVSVPYTTNASSQYVSGISSAVESARKALDANLQTRQSANDAQLAKVKEKEQQTLDKIGTLSTPFREDLETSQRESLSVNKNFTENQKLVDELDQLLTEGNNLIRQQQAVTGIAAIRNPRIQQTMNDVAARAGVIQAVMAARNSQISVAENMIDRSINAIALDRQDQLNYYNTILQLNNQDKLALTDENKTIAMQQVALLQNDLEQAQQTAQMVKGLMLDPATAQLVADSGVTLNDSVETISAKLAQGRYQQEVNDIANTFALDGAKPISDPSTVSAKQLRTYIDSRGVPHYFKIQETTSTTYTKNTAADSWLQTEQTTKNTTKSPITSTQNKFGSQISPETYATVFSITADVLGNAPVAGSSASIRK